MPLDALADYIRFRDVDNCCYSTPPFLKIEWPVFTCVHMGSATATEKRGGCYGARGDRSERKKRRVMILGVRDEKEHMKEYS